MHACVYKCVGASTWACVCVHTQEGSEVDTKLPVSLLGDNAPLDRTQNKEVIGYLAHSGRIWGGHKTS